MDAKLKEARNRIASEIGSDVGYFTPPDEKRFTGIEVMLAIGGAFLFGFFKGLASKAGEKIGEHLGEELGGYISKKIDELRGKDRSAQEQLLEEARREAEGKVRAAGLTEADVHAIVVVVEAEFAKALPGEPTPEVRARVARSVSAAAEDAL